MPDLSAFDVLLGVEAEAQAFSLSPQLKSVDDAEELNQLHFALLKEDGVDVFDFVKCYEGFGPWRREGESSPFDVADDLLIGQLNSVEVATLVDGLDVLGGR